jgi:toxin FitB
MIILDTNIISELMRNRPEPKVIRWVNEQIDINLYSTAITAAELRAGATVMPSGKNKIRILEQLRLVFEEDFGNRVLAFDDECAKYYASIVSERKLLGKPILQIDAMIASICAKFGAAICTRDVGGFSHCGLRVINPWAD